VAPAQASGAPLLKRTPTSLQSRVGTDERHIISDEAMVRTLILFFV